MSRAPGRAGICARPSWVVVPARNEVDHLGAAIAAIDAAALEVAERGPVHLVLVDDASTDGTTELVAAAIREWSHGNARHLGGPAAGSGPARRAGLDAALAAAASADALIATTDADTVVPCRWLRSMHALLDRGAEVIAGDIRLERGADPALAAARERRLARRLEALRAHQPSASHPHFGGANLGFSAAALAQLRPIPAPTALEDDALAARCEQIGLQITRDLSFPVTTSARTQGRAAVGLATALAADRERLGLPLSR